MTRYFLLLYILTGLVSCDDPAPDFSTQDIGNVAWRGNGSMLVFAERRQYATSGALEYKLYSADGQGKLGDALGSEITGESVPPIYISDDAMNSVTVAGQKLIRQDFSNNSRKEMTSKVTQLYAVSPDLKYALVTHAEYYQPIKKVSLLDISGSSARSVREWDIKGLTANAGFWLNEGKIALNIDTGSKPFLNIYDSSGSVVGSIEDAQSPPASSDYEPSTNSVFVKNSFGGLVRVNVANGTRSNLLDNYLNIDVRGNTLAYVENVGGKQTLYLQNLTTGETKSVADDVARYVFLSPDVTKLAYVVQSRFNFTEVKVISITAP